MMKRFLTIFSGILLVAALIGAQAPSGSVKGQVFHDDGFTPYSGCVILLENVNENLSDIEYRSEPADDSGYYSIVSVPPGIYKVKLVRPNKKKARKTLTIVHVVSGEIVDHSIFDRSKKASLGFLKSPCTFLTVLLTGVFFFI